MASIINSYPNVRSFTDKGFKNKAIGDKLRGLTLKQFFYKPEEEQEQQVESVSEVDPRDDARWAQSARERFEQVGYAVEAFFLSVVTHKRAYQGSVAKQARTLRKEALRLAKERKTPKVPTKEQMEQAALLAADLGLNSDFEFISEFLMKAYK